MTNSNTRCVARRVTGSAQKEQAQVECDDLRIEFEAYQRLDAEAEKELHMQERLYEAKQKRIDKSQAGRGETRQWLAPSPDFRNTYEK